MIIFVNQLFMQFDSLETSKNNEYGACINIMPCGLNAPPSPKARPLCKIFTHDSKFRDDFMNDPNSIKNFNLSCNNAMNDTTHSINTTFDYIENVEESKYYVIAIPFNGILKEVKFDENLEVLNGSFIKTEPFDVEVPISDDKTRTIKYSKIAYFIFKAKVLDDIEMSITLKTCSIGNDKKKPEVTVRSEYTNIFKFSDTTIATEDDIYLSESKKDSTCEIDSDDTFKAPSFNSFFVDIAHIDKHFTPKPRNQRFGNNKKVNNRNTSSTISKPRINYATAGFAATETKDDVRKTRNDRMLNAAKKKKYFE